MGFQDKHLEEGVHIGSFYAVVKVLLEQFRRVFWVKFPGINTSGAIPGDSPEELPKLLRERLWTVH